MSIETKWAREFAERAYDEHALVRRLNCRVLYFSKAELVTVATDLGLDATGPRIDLCYRIARHLLA